MSSTQLFQTEITNAALLDTLWRYGDNRPNASQNGPITRVIDDASLRNLDDFLASVERRAYRIAYIASGNREDALDLVQDAMCKLVEKYSAKPAAEWGALFHRILQSKIRDRYRRESVRNRFRVWLGGQADDGFSDIEQLAVETLEQPPVRADDQSAMRQLDAALHALPLRQQQAFLLRAWEGLSTRETAAAMSCSEGSVKTHYSRAVHTLRDQLEDYRD
ncbi:MAG: RNA polymerase sigma factor [Pseudomonadota bacterium]